MNSEQIKNIMRAWQEVVEKKTMDPVDKKALKKDFDARADKDIDNDGDVDKSDEYLHNRRKAIGKAMKNESEDEKMKPCPKCDGSMDNHDPDCPMADNDDDDDMDEASCGKKMKKESVELGEATLAKQWQSRKSPVKSGDVELIRRADGVHLIKKNGKAVGNFYLDIGPELWVVNIFGQRREGIVDEVDDVVKYVNKHLKESVELGESITADTKYGRAHDKAMELSDKAKKSKKIDDYVDAIKAHKQALKLAKGVTNQSAHRGHIKDLSSKLIMAEEVELGDDDDMVRASDKIRKMNKESVAHEKWGYGEVIEESENGYNVYFEHGVEFDVPADQLIVLEKNYSMRTKGATKPETMKDKLKGKGAQDMAKDADMDNPELAADDAKGHEDATKAGRAVNNQAPTRGGEKRIGDKGIVNPVKGAVTSTTGKEG